jgi:hypothetical protein
MAQSLWTTRGTRLNDSDSKLSPAELSSSFINSEPEVLVPVTCPVCFRESLAGFRFSVITHALETGDIRLYTNCHIASWHGTLPELAALRDYLDTVWGTGLHEACEEFFSLDQFLDSESLSFIYSGVIDSKEMPQSADGYEAALSIATLDETISMSFSQPGFKHFELKGLTDLAPSDEVAMLEGGSLSLL